MVKIGCAVRSSTPPSEHACPGAQRLLRQRVRCPCPGPEDRCHCLEQVWTAVRTLLPVTVRPAWAPAAAGRRPFLTGTACDHRGGARACRAPGAGVCASPCACPSSSLPEHGSHTRSPTFLAVRVCVLVPQSGACALGTQHRRHAKEADPIENSAAQRSRVVFFSNNDQRRRTCFSCCCRRRRSRFVSCGAEPSAVPSSPSSESLMDCRSALWTGG